MKEIARGRCNNFAKIAEKTLQLHTAIGHEYVCTVGGNLNNNLKLTELSLARKLNIHGILN